VEGLNSERTELWKDRGVEGVTSVSSETWVELVIGDQKVNCEMSEFRNECVVELVIYERTGL